MKKNIDFIIFALVFFALIIITGCASAAVETQTLNFNTEGTDPSFQNIENLDEQINNEQGGQTPIEQEQSFSETITESTIKTPNYILRKPEGNKILLTESWGYVMKGREDEFDNSVPITDICYFAADINCYGELMDVPSRNKLKTNKNQRCHLVIACDSRGAVHQALNPVFETRKQILKDIVRAAAPYDGVQLDLEYIPLRDRKHFITFIGDLRYMLKGKTLSVCVPARFRLLKDDMYPYKEIALYSDRVFVMAYDEHWSTSRPGAIANIEWCKKIAQYATQSIPERKLIMGIPFYGRTWASELTASAWYFSGMNRIMTEHDVKEVVYEDDIPTVHYTANIDITAYFNDAYSCVKLCQTYQDMGIKKIGYWRLGQEDSEFWNWVEIQE